MYMPVAPIRNTYILCTCLWNMKINIADISCHLFLPYEVFCWSTFYYPLPIFEEKIGDIIILCVHPSVHKVRENLFRKYGISVQSKPKL